MSAVIQPKVTPRPQPQRRPARPWRHAESMFTLATGSNRWGEQLKQQALSFVAVTTDDGEIPFGLLIRNDEDNQIRVAHRVSVLRNPNEIGESPLNMRRRVEWRLDAIARDRITDYRVLS